MSRPPAGPARRGLTGCIAHGHPLTSKPNYPQRRYCQTCARRAAAEQTAAIAAAAQCLGTTLRDYTRSYGQSTRRALEVLAECEQANAEWIIQP